MRPREQTQSAGADHYRRLERAWQDEIGRQLLDVPHEQPGSAAVVRRQHARIAAALDLAAPGVVVEVGCGHGQLLEHLRAVAVGTPVTFVGIELSHAVEALRARGLLGIRADGEHLPFRDQSVRALVYDGALHHLIDYRAALCEAHRVLVPGGKLILLEPVTSPFTRMVSALRDRLEPRSAARESPIDLHYRSQFRETAILESLRVLDMSVRHERTDFLAYPVTGAYSGFSAGRSARLIGTLLSLERAFARRDVLRRLAALFAWRFLVVATK